jgi:hypothetical protein
MVQANLKIIAELKSVLHEVSTNPSLRSLFTDSPGSFSRNRKLTLNRLVGIIINLPKRSLSIEIREFFEVIEQDQIASKGAFSLQRSKLLPVFFRMWNKWLVDSFYKFYGQNVKRWKGFRLLAMDGSLVYLVNNPEVIKYFGTQVNQHYAVPMGRVLQTYDVLNNIIVSSNIYPLRYSEQALSRNEIGHLPDDSLILFDRGFPGFELMYLMQNQECPRHFIIRCPSDFNLEVSHFEKSNLRDQIITLQATTCAVKKLRERGYIITRQTSIKIRMVKVKLSSSQTEILLTNLYDTDQYSVKDLKYLYNLRWGIETCFGAQKNQLQLEQFSGHRVICIQQDFAANVFVYNLQSLLEKQCEEHLNQINLKRKHRYKINRNVSWACLKNNIVRFFFSNDPSQLLRKLQDALERNIEPVRPNRKYPISLKKKRLNGKFITVTNYKRAI